jgi:Tfp pilus assembly protein PilX
MTQTGSTQTASLVAGYFNQGTHYYSESEGAMISIAEMAPKHAANAAERLLRDAEHWASEAGTPERPFTWAASTPLVRALWTRSQATRPDASDAVKAAMGRYRQGLKPSR